MKVTFTRSIIVLLTMAQLTACGLTLKSEDAKPTPPPRPSYTLSEYKAESDNLDQVESLLNTRELCSYYSSSVDGDALRLKCWGAPRQSTALALEDFAARIDGFMAKYENAIIKDGGADKELNATAKVIFRTKALLARNKAAEIRKQIDPFQTLPQN